MAKQKTRRYMNELFEAHRQFKPTDRWVTGGDMDWRYLPYGTQRRVLLLKHLRDGEPIYVNRKWQLQTKYDQDLKKLLKKGVIRIVKSGIPFCRQTTVELVSK
ncbi:hypothetical protein [Pectobacterium phage Wc4-1]|uniref:Uncharacterized protein n=2 Tax=Arnovirus TaxID=3425109 RepID=A0A5P8D4E5_9CAUD|nr:hypothetical protein Arno162_39 [Pectobacterium phage Arno162]QFP93905.1 hypothetical protein [Pectobacterium phage Wc4]QFP94050.1 hypothetical protein [Pectobacterium phage Wc4-1]